MFFPAFLSYRSPAAVLLEEQMTLDVKTGAKSRPAKALSSMEEGESYARPKVSSNDGFHAMRADGASSKRVISEE